MAEIKAQLPVYLPGNDRDWTKVQGLATVTDEGEINIKLRDKNYAIDLANMFKKGILIQLAFDYQMNDAMIEHIQNRHKEKK